MKSLKTKVTKIQNLSSKAVHGVPVMLLIHHILLHGLMIKISGKPLSTVKYYEFALKISEKHTKDCYFC